VETAAVFAAEGKELEDEDVATALDTEAAAKLTTHRKKKKTKGVTAEAAPAPAPAVHLGEGHDHTWNDWSQASFGGDAARQSKFLRLMGAPAAAVPASAAAKGKAPAAEAAFKVRGSLM
jgi:hypothetical protein